MPDTTTVEGRTARQRQFDREEIERLARNGEDKGRGSMQAIILGNKFGLGDYCDGDKDQFNR